MKMYTKNLSCFSKPVVTKTTFQYQAALLPTYTACTITFVHVVDDGNANYSLIGTLENCYLNTCVV